MLISFIFSYLETFFVVFSISFYFYLATGRSARHPSPLTLVVTCGLTTFTRVFPCTKQITGVETIKILLEELFCVYGAPKEIYPNEDVRVRSDTGWYKRVLRSLNVQVSTGIPYTHTSNPLCERQIRVLKESMRIWCKTERTKDWVRLLPVISLMMNSQESSATGDSPHELLTGRPAWFLHAPYPEVKVCNLLVLKATGCWRLCLNFHR